MLRDYQQNAHDEVIAFNKKSTESCVIEAATGSGKSHIITALSKTYLDISHGKRVLCTAPSAELVKQNHTKYLATGNPASMFSSSVGEVSLRHPVTFGTPKTILNRIRQFKHQFAALVIDECHSITPTIKQIAYYLKQNNPNMRVVGMTATPYRLRSGHIYEIDTDDQVSEGIEPYFKKCVYRITAPELIDRGFLTAPKIITPGMHYDTSHLKLNSMFKYKDMDQAFEGHGRKTSRIIADIVNKSQGKRGVLIFAATVRHAHECLASLPPELSAIITGTTSKNERKDIIARFNAQQIKYIVNVGVLTTGFDAPHVDVIAVLRLTESISLLQQIIGRGSRLYPDKDYFLILDYAENIKRHCPDGDIFSPQIVAKVKEQAQEMDAECEHCLKVNRFTMRENKDGFKHDKNGYFVDLRGKRISTDLGPIPAHYGRRCLYYVGTERCNYRWTSKKCPECEQDNDIAARYCTKCKHELVNPNDKLSIFESNENKMLEIITIHEKAVKTKKGDNAMLVNFVTKSGIYPVWFMTQHKYLRYKFLDYKRAKDKGIKGIKLESKNGFYKVASYAFS